ncbi:hypothetical protein AB0J80_12285 [Actinoplanes sp. NPDC049548]|uniref:hypothetical protein n=1 Tax=Actinoplanes sp. NPDC049548 TaxID=3155152 RepID=UPI003447B673
MPVPAVNDEVAVVVTAINPWGVEVATLGDDERGFIDNLKLPADSTPAVGDELAVVVLDDERTPFRASLLDADFAIARKPCTAYDYRLLKAPWGIRITFIAEVEPFSDRRTATPVGHGVRVKHGLDEEQGAAVAAGLANCSRKRTMRRSREATSLPNTHHHPEPLIARTTSPVHRFRTVWPTNWHTSTIRTSVALRCSAWRRRTLRRARRRSAEGT